MKKIIAPIFGIMCMSGAIADNIDLDSAMANVRAACSGISKDMSELKTKAGINTAITAVGTVSGGVALGTGIAKANVDKEVEKLESILKKLEAAEQDDAGNITETTATTSDFEEIYLNATTVKTTLSELNEKSKTLGNVRTGTLAASTVTNVAGTAIAATNKIDKDLFQRIDECIAASKQLANSRLAAKVEGTASAEKLDKADKMSKACREYELVDLKSVNSRATGAAISSGIGIGTGLVGTITSAVANTNSTRQGDANKEKTLNTTANVMAGASTVASATATILNGTQIAAIKRVAKVADECEGAL